MESFVLNELLRQATTIDEAITFAHFRDRSGIEVDIIVERPDGAVVAIESCGTLGRSNRHGVAHRRPVPTAKVRPARDDSGKLAGALVLDAPNPPDEVGGDRPDG